MGFIASMAPGILALAGIASTSSGHIVFMRSAMWRHQLDHRVEHRPLHLHLGVRAGQLEAESPGAVGAEIHDLDVAAGSSRWDEKASLPRGTVRSPRRVGLCGPKEGG